MTEWTTTMDLRGWLREAILMRGCGNILSKEILCLAVSMGTSLMHEGR